MRKVFVSFTGATNFDQLMFTVLSLFFFTNLIFSADVDFDEVVGLSISLNRESRTQCFSVSILDDALVELDENFLLLLDTPDSNVDLVRDSASVSIRDDDVVMIGWSLGSYEVVEDGSSVRVCASIMQGEISRPLMVLYSTSDGTAQSKTCNRLFWQHLVIKLCLAHLILFVMSTGSDDYTSVTNAELVFNPNFASQSVCDDLQVREDGAYEADETIIVILSTSDRAVILNPAVSTINIRNDDRK